MDEAFEAPDALGAPVAETDTAPEAEESAPVSDAEPSAIVDHANLVACVAGLPLQQRQDVIDSLLLAQLAADNSHNRSTAMEAWYGRYCEVLSHIGWACGSFRFRSHKVRGNAAAMATLVLEVLGAIARQDHLATAQKAIKALAAKAKDDPNARTFEVWKSATQDGDVNDFQLSLCHNEGNTVGLASAALRVSTDAENAKFLWAKQSEMDMDIEAASLNMVLNVQVYGSVRDAVVSKLGRRAKDHVAALELN